MPRRSLALARALPDLKPGEMVLLTGDGSVRRRSSLVGSAAVGVGISLGLAAIGPAASMVGGGVALGGLAYMRLAGGAYRRALVAAASWDDDTALTELERARRSLPFPGRAHALARLESTLRWRRGEHAAALEALDAVVLAGGRRRIGWWMAALDRVQLLLAMGRIADARAFEPTLAGAPGGEYIRSELDLLELLFAFADGGEPPPSDRLHELAHTYLGYELVGHTVQVLLAWAFARRGDDETAGLCLRRAEETAPPAPRFLEHTAPAVAAWVAEHRDRLLAAAPSLTGDDAFGP